MADGRRTTSPEAIGCEIFVLLRIQQSAKVQDSASPPLSDVNKRSGGDDRSASCAAKQTKVK